MKRGKGGEVNLQTLWNLITIVYERRGHETISNRNGS